MHIEESVSSQGHVGRQRSLQMASARKQHSGSATVTTATQLSAEITKGTPHIEIRQHIDLSALSDLEFGGSRKNGTDASTHGSLPTTIKSIRVRLHSLPWPRSQIRCHCGCYRAMHTCHAAAHPPVSLSLMYQCPQRLQYTSE